MSEKRKHFDVAASRPADNIVGSLVDAFEGRKRVFLVALVNGQSRALAATSAGVTPRTTQYWASKDPTFAEAAEAAAQYGFAAVIEPELYRRATAGVDDRSSMRALEMVVKQRDPSYRDKAPVEVDLVGGIPASIARFSPERLGLTPDGKKVSEQG